MADTQTTNLLLVNQEIGAHDNTWGDVLNANNDLIDSKFGDVTGIVSTGGTTVLTDDEERVNLLEVSGALVSNKVLQFTGRGGTWLIENNTTGSYTLTCKLSAEAGCTIPQGGKAVIYCDGVGIRRLVTTPVPVADGGTGLTSGASTGMVLLASGTASGSTSLDIDLDAYGSTYRALKLVLTGFKGSSDGFYPFLRVSTNGGSSFAATDYAYSHLEIPATGSLAADETQLGGSGGINTGGTEIPLLPGWYDPGNAATEGIDAEITIYDHANAARWTNFIFDLVFLSNAGTPVLVRVLGSGSYRQAAAVTDIALDALLPPSTANTVSGKWALYGLL